MFFANLSLICVRLAKPVFSSAENRFSKAFSLKCPYCSHTLACKKDRKHFIIHKCVNPKCSYYFHNLKKVDNDDYAKNKYKLYFTIFRNLTKNKLFY
ncbi:hypothetical protein EII17_12350 [Clostridiales bacterium COT073_COT-073]|nr:hypothetical protein EII17_12350 [Clostridiales bacterium COT073_COT-073]